jgi:deoxyhypusine synthase
MSAPNQNIQTALDAVMVKTTQDSAQNLEKVQGYDFNQGIDYDKILQSYYTTGFQALHFGRAVKSINRMLEWRLSDEPIGENDDDTIDRSKVKATVFLGYTSNMVSCGLRETIKFLAQHKLIDCIVTTAGGVEEDFIKCMADTYLGEFTAKGSELRAKGLNRIGNLLIPNDNYCKFEDWLTPILDAMKDEEKQTKVPWTPSKIINRLGKEINNEDSIYYWCWKNDIPVFCPAITDGSLGDMFFFHSINEPGITIDILADLRQLNLMAMNAPKTGCVILGGGVIKHHICNANLMRNGTDWAVYINTGHEWDGSDAGASPDEAVSWGKIGLKAESIKIHSEATLIFPIFVAQTFAKYYFDHIKPNENKEAK